MAVNSLVPGFTELQRIIAREVGAAPTSGSWTSLQSNDFSDAIESGLRRFYYPPVLPGEAVPHVWSFLQPTLASIEIHAAYATGTISVTTGTVTLASGTWPSWAADGEIYVDGGWYTVASRTNGTTVVLDDSSVTGLSGETYTLLHREYDLPSDFGGMVEPFSLRRDQTQWSQYGGDKRLVQVGEAMIRGCDDANNAYGPPELFAIVSVAPTSSTESRNRVIVAPIPDQTYKLWYRYAVTPPTLDAVTNVYAYGSAPYSETLILSCVDSVLQKLYGSAEKHQAFMESLIAAVHRDRLVQGPVRIGKVRSSDMSEYDRRDFIRRQATLDITGYGL